MLDEMATLDRNVYDNLAGVPGARRVRLWFRFHHAVHRRLMDRVQFGDPIDQVLFWLATWAGRIADTIFPRDMVFRFWPSAEWRRLDFELVYGTGRDREIVGIGELWRDEGVDVVVNDAPPGDPQVEKGEWYVCAVCGGRFEAGWSNEEANTEADMLFPGARGSTDMSVVCDDCHKEVMAWAERTGYPLMPKPGDA